MSYSPNALQIKKAHMVLSGFDRAFDAQDLVQRAAPFARGYLSEYEFWLGVGLRSDHPGLTEGHLRALTKSAMVLIRSGMAAEQERA